MLDTCTRFVLKKKKEEEEGGQRLAVPTSKNQWKSARGGFHGAVCSSWPTIRHEPAIIPRRDCTEWPRLRNNRAPFIPFHEKCRANHNSQLIVLLTRLGKTLLRSLSPTPSWPTCEKRHLYPGDLWRSHQGTSIKDGSRVNVFLIIRFRFAKFQDCESIAVEDEIEGIGGSMMMMMMKWRWTIFWKVCEISRSINSEIWSEKELWNLKIMKV